MKNEKTTPPFTDDEKPTPITDAMEDVAEGVRRVTAIGPTTKAVGVVGSTAVTALGVAAATVATAGATIVPALFFGGLAGLGYTLTRRTRKPVGKCTACGAKLSVGDRFCRGCGNQKE